MKLVLYCSGTAPRPCVDWPTALVALRCIGSPAWVEREDPASGKALIASILDTGKAKLLVSRWQTTRATLMRLTDDEIDRLMVGEDL